MIELAERTIDLATFILARDPTGDAVLEALERKARQRVTVRVLVDAFFAFVRITLGLAGKPGPTNPRRNERSNGSTPPNRHPPRSPFPRRALSFPIFPFFVPPGGGVPPGPPIAFAPLPAANAFVSIIIASLMLLLRFALRRFQ